MSRLDDHAYYARRADEEISRGDQAIDAAIAAIHYELARRYARLVAARIAPRPRFTLIDGGKDQLAA